ncbi:MAG: hypothetical protein ACO3GO_02955 [Terrimicrobiaceae bacterium]
MKTSTVRFLHRWLGLVFSLVVLTSALSGVLHTIMARKQPPPPPVRPSGNGIVAGEIRTEVKDAVERLGPDFGQVSAVNLRMIGGVPWYQIYGPQPAPAYVSATNGTVDPAQDAKFAAQIASSFLGGAAVRQTDYLTAFNHEYVNIFRILPVYRFDVDDGLGTRVYVSTTTGTVTRHTDNERQFEANVFFLFHKFGFIKDRDTRDTVLASAMIGISLVALGGVVLFFMTRPRRKTSQNP